VIKDWVLDANCGVAMRKFVAGAMAGRTVTLTTVEVGGETEQAGGSGRHMERERGAGNVGNNSRAVSATRCGRGDLVQATVMGHEVEPNQTPHSLGVALAELTAAVRHSHAAHAAQCGLKFDRRW
jgi:hypothetical protein